MNQHDAIASTKPRIATPDPYKSRAFPTGSDLSTFVAELRLIKQDLRRNRDLKDPAYGLFIRTTCLKFRNGPPIVSPTRVDRYFKNIKAFQLFGVGAKKIEGAEAPPRPFLNHRGKPLVDASGRPETWFPGERWTAEIGCQSAERLRLVAGVLARMGLLCHKYLAPEPWYLLADRDAEHEIYRRITHECGGGLDPLMAHCWRPVWDETHGDNGALDGPDPRPEMMALDDLEGIASRLVSIWQSRAEGDAAQKPPATTAAPPPPANDPHPGSTPATSKRARQLRRRRWMARRSTELTAAGMSYHERIARLAAECQFEGHDAVSERTVEMDLQWLKNNPGKITPPAGAILPQ